MFFSELAGLYFVGDADQEVHAPDVHVERVYVPPDEKDFVLYDVLVGVV